MNLIAEAPCRPSADAPAGGWSMRPSGSWRSALAPFGQRRNHRLIHPGAVGVGGDPDSLAAADLAFKGVVALQSVRDEPEGSDDRCRLHVLTRVARRDAVF